MKQKANSDGPSCRTADATPQRRRRWNALLAVCCLVLLTGGLRAYRLNACSVWFDDYVSVVGADAPTLRACLDMRSHYDPFLFPLYHMVQYGWAQTVSSSVAGIRLFSIVFSLFSVLLLYLLGRRMYGHWAGMIAGLCFALSPFQIFHGQGIRYYALVTCLTLVSCYAFFGLVRGRGVLAWSIHIAANGLLMWTHFFALLLLAPQGLFLLLFRFRWWRRIALWTGLHGLLLALLALWLRSSHMGISPTTGESPLQWWDLFHDVFSKDTTNIRWTVGAVPRCFDPSLLPDYVRFLLDFRMPLERLLAWGMCLGCLLLFLQTLYGAWSSRLRNPTRPDSTTPFAETRNDGRDAWERFAFLLLWLVMPSAIVFLYAKLTNQWFFSARYTMFALPALYLIAGGALGNIRWRAPRVCLSALLVLLFGFQTVLSVSLPRRDDHLSAARLIQSTGSPDEPVLAGPGHETEVFAFNLAQDVVGDKGLQPLVGVNDAQEMMSKTDAALGAGRNAWVVYVDGACSEAASVFDRYLGIRGIPFTKAVFLGVKYVYVFHCVRDAQYHPPESPESLTALRAAVDQAPQDTALRLRLAGLMETAATGGAVEEYRKAVESGPPDRWFYIRMSELLLNKDDLDGALEACRKGIDLGAADAELYCRMGEILARKGDINGAVDACRKAVALTGAAAGAAAGRLGSAAATLQEAGAISQALETWRAALALDPTNPWVRSNLCRLLFQQGNADEAIALLDQAIDASPNDAAPYAELDNALLRLKDPGRRIAAWRDRAARHPGAAAPLLHLGAALQDAQDLNGAFEAYRKALGVAPNDAATLARLGAAQEELGDVNGARASYEKAVAVDPNNGDYLCRLGGALAAQGLAAEALQTCRKAVAVDGSFSSAAANRLTRAAAKFTEKSDWARAAELYQAALDLDPKDLGSRDGLATVLDQQGRSEEALNALRAGVDLNPAAWQVYSGLDRLLRARADAQARVAEWRRCADRHPGVAFPNYYLGLALAGVNDKEGALQALRRAGSTDCAEPGFLFELGRTLVEFGDHASAVRPLRGALDLAPHYGPTLSPLLIGALCAARDYDAAWIEVRRCRESNVQLDPQLIERLRSASGRSE